VHEDRFRSSGDDASLGASDRSRVTPPESAGDKLSLGAEEAEEEKLRDSLDPERSSTKGNEPIPRPRSFQTSTNDKDDWRAFCSISRGRDFFKLFFFVSRSWRTRVTAGYGEA